ncbi:zinc finger protein 521-like isoform X2 [Ruditapes philippinarum]|nr:zinc finger protein 521-like isoform X2 [Ruditapes philippinarum]
MGLKKNKGPHKDNNEEKKFQCRCGKKYTILKHFMNHVKVCHVSGSDKPELPAGKGKAGSRESPTWSSRTGKGKSIDSKLKEKTSLTKKKTDRSHVTETKVKSRKKKRKETDTDFTCSICSSTFRNGDDLHKHFKRSRCAIGSFPKLTQRLKGQIVNEETPVRKVQYRCGFCSLTFTDSSYLELHVSSGCPSRSENSEISYSDNRLSSQLERIPDNDKLSCGLGKTSYDMELFHPMVNIECGLCHVKFESQDDLISHFESKHECEKDSDNDVDKLGDIDYICGKCNLELDSIKEMKSHLRLCFADINSVFTCGQCQKEFGSHDDLQSHISENHSASEFVCGQCGNSFQSTKLLVQHIAKDHTVPDSPLSEGSPAKEHVSGYDNDTVTVPTSLLIRYLSKIQCGGCFNTTQLNISGKCTFCNQPINVKLNKIMCLCTQILFQSVDTLMSHLCSCEDIHTNTNRNNLVLKASKKDDFQRICVDNHVVDNHVICPEVVDNLHIQNVNESMKEEIDADNVDELKEKEKEESFEAVRETTEYSPVNTKGGKEKVEDKSLKPKEKLVFIEDDTDSELSDTDSSGFEEIAVDIPSPRNKRTKSRSGRNEDHSSSSDLDMHETELKHIENKLQERNALEKYNIWPCKVVVERMTLLKLERYLGKRKRTTSPEGSDGLQFKRARTERFDRKTDERTANVQGDAGFKEKLANAQENVTKSKAVAKKKSFHRNDKRKVPYSQERRKSTRSNLVDCFKNKDSVHKKVSDKILKVSVDFDKAQNNKKEEEQHKKLDKLLKYSPLKNNINTSKKTDKVDCTSENIQSQADKNEEILTCEICTLTFSSTPALEQHAETHLPAQMFQCGICEDTFSSENRLKEHMDSHVHNDEFVCGICQSKFTSPDELELHIYKHFNSPVSEQKETEPLVKLKVNADSSDNVGAVDLKEENQGQQVLPKLLAYKPKFIL